MLNFDFIFQGVIRDASDLELFDDDFKRRYTERQTDFFEEGSWKQDPRR